jgi:NADH-quinone oxidoreductase subunit D
MFDTNELVINMGPQHPSTHGVLRVVLRLDGEKVVDADVVIGYLHRGIEKLSENRNWTQIILLTDRMDYVAAATNNVGYCETVEKLMSLEVPRRARYVRTILCELQRIASHCLWVGTHAMDIGAMTVFLYAFRERELISICSRSSAARASPTTRCGSAGCRRICRQAGTRRSSSSATIMTSKIDEYEELLTHNRIWLERTKGIGIISGAEASPRLERSAAARLGRAARRPQGRTLRRLRRDGVRRAGRHRRRHLRSVPRADGGVPPVAAHHPQATEGIPKGRSSARCRA